MAAQSEIDLKLFDNDEFDRLRGCTVGLWQADRHPSRDRFAYVFLESLGSRTLPRQPARIRIGTQSVAYQRVATGGRTSGHGLTEYQLYRGANADDFLILDLNLRRVKAGRSISTAGP